MEASIALRGSWRSENASTVIWLAHMLFPFIVVSTILNQQRPFPALMLLGQIISITCVVIAITLPIVALPGRAWPIILAGITVALRFMRVMMGGHPLVEMAYAIAVGLEFSAAGAVVAIAAPARLRRQMMIFMALSLGLMLLQLLGVGAWTQVLRTDFHAEDEQTLKQYATFLIPFDQIVPTTIQLRPAGFMAANNVFSVFLVTALAFHYGSPHAGRLSWRDIVLCMTTTVAMAKIGVLAFVFFMLALFASRDPGRCWLALKVCAVFAICAFAYAVFFPGAFEFNMTIDLWWLNFQVRAVDWLFAAGRPELSDMIGALGVSQDIVARSREQPGTESGYAVLASHLNLLIAAAATLVFLYWLGIRAVDRRYRAWASISRFCGIAVLLVPLISPLIETNIFAFLVGIAFTPVFLRFDKRYDRLFVISDLRPSMHRAPAVALRRPFM